MVLSWLSENRLKSMTQEPDKIKIKSKQANSTKGPKNTGKVKNTIMIETGRQ